MKLSILLASLALTGVAFADMQVEAPAIPATAPSVSHVRSVMATGRLPLATSEDVLMADKAQFPFGHLTEPMGYLAFAAIIKYQFPGHDALDSLALAQSAVEAYPVYASFVIFPPAK